MIKKNVLCTGTHYTVLFVRVRIIYRYRCLLRHIIRYACCAMHQSSSFELDCGCVPNTADLYVFEGQDMEMGAHETTLLDDSATRRFHGYEEWR